MIISFSKKFIFLKNMKVGGSSVEFYLSQFCNQDDIITPLLKDEEKLKKKYGLPSAQNIKLKQFSLGSRSLRKLSFFKEKIIFDHATIDQILKTNLKNKIKNFFIFSFIRNPFDWIVSYFWWHLSYEKKINVSKLNKISDKIISIKFKSFLKEKSSDFFIKAESIFKTKKANVRLFKYENFNSNIDFIKKKLNLKKEKIKINNINFKKLKIKKVIKIDNQDRELIIKNALKLFEKGKYSKRLPIKYK